jgi:2-keto-4-pentenoate hydratase/2-oxohepta-3-ene-1,7-dioic acid hydratase in catechol pathway
VTGGINTRSYFYTVQPNNTKVGPAAILLATVCSLLPQAAAEADPLFTAPPRVMRYISTDPRFNTQACFGVVLAERNGVPEKVYNLGHEDPRLCSAAQSSAPTPGFLEQAFTVADALLSRGSESRHRELTEDLHADNLADIVLPPVAVSMQQLESEQRFIVGVGLNYLDHREEVAAETHIASASASLLVFPKVVEPTGAYSPVVAGTQIGTRPAEPVRLLDYEVELALVLLKDLDLKALPSSYEEFIQQVAFFAANDVSDREPIILDSENGYTRGKSHPTYLPLGPWMIHGRHLQPRAPNEGHTPLELVLRLQEAAQPSHPARTRILQSSSTDLMLFGPWHIVKLLSTRYRNGIRTCMRDANGEARYTHTADGLLPAGSIILTGTPGGTAIREPDTLEKLGLFLRGGLSIAGARRQMIEDTEAHLEETDYLEPGDRVETRVERLGRQRWTIVQPALLSPYGVNVPAACSVPAETSR